MNILELFSGTESFSNEARKRGYDCDTVDNDERFNPTWVKDLRIWRPDPKYTYDILWASPPCTAFSVASIGKHWGGGFRKYKPKTQTARDGLLLLENTLEIIKEIKPKYFFIENPRGVMRKMSILRQWEAKGLLRRDTITYCQYGDDRMKPTDIWHNCWNWKPRKKCKNGDSCHEAAPRGSKTGTQGLKGSVARSVVPPDLCNEILDAIESGETKKRVSKRTPKTWNNLESQTVFLASNESMAKEVSK